MLRGKNGFGVTQKADRSLRNIRFLVVLKNLQASVYIIYVYMHMDYIYLQLVVGLKMKVFSSF